MTQVTATITKNGFSDTTHKTEYGGLFDAMGWTKVVGAPDTANVEYRKFSWATDVVCRVRYNYTSDAMLEFTFGKATEFTVGTGTFTGTTETTIIEAYLPNSTYTPSKNAIGINGDGYAGFFVEGTSIAFAIELVDTKCLAIVHTTEHPSLESYWQYRSLIFDWDNSVVTSYAGSLFGGPQCIISLQAINSVHLVGRRVIVPTKHGPTNTKKILLFNRNWSTFVSKNAVTVVDIPINGSEVADFVIKADDNTFSSTYSFKFVIGIPAG